MKNNKNRISSLIFILFMGCGYPLIRFISKIFDPININAIMFLSGGTLFLLMSLIRFYGEFLKLKKNLWIIPRLFILAGHKKNDEVECAGGIFSRLKSPIDL